MGWLGDGSHRGQVCQAWTAVGLPPRYPRLFMLSITAGHNVCRILLVKTLWGEIAKKTSSNTPKCYWFVECDLRPWQRSTSTVWETESEHQCNKNNRQLQMSISRDKEQSHPYRLNIKTNNLQLLADPTNGHADATELCLSVVCL